MLIASALFWTTIHAQESSVRSADGSLLAKLMYGINMLFLEEKRVVAPDFSLHDLSGKEVKLSDFRGKVVLLNFFATWCYTCLWEMPEIEVLHDKYKERGFTVVAVSLDLDGPDKVKEFAEERGLTFPIVMDPKKEVARRYSLKGPPVSYLIDGNGYVVGLVFGPTNWSDRRAFNIVEHYIRSSGDSAQ